jgi:hypothetical protein
MPLLFAFCLIASLIISHPSASAATRNQNGAANTAATSPASWRTPHAAQQSPFVSLSMSILNNSFVFSTFNDFGSNAFDPNITDRVLVTRDTRWAFGRIDTNVPYIPLSKEEKRAGNGLGIRPLSVELGNWHPFFGKVWVPGSFLGSSGGSFDAFTWMHESLASATTQTSSPSSDDKDIDFSDGSNHAPLAYRYAVDKKTSLNAGVNWIHDLSDTTGMAQALEDPGSDSSGKASGVNVSLGARYKAVTLTGGYIRAMDPRSPVDLALDSKTNDPVAWNSELAYSTELLRRETTLAIGYLKASDGLNAVLPEERYSTKASMALSNSTTLSLEYYQDREIAVGNGEEDGYGITTRIGFDF